MEMKPKIFIETHIDAPLERVWTCYNDPQHIVHWNAAHESWHCPSSHSDLREGGRFVHRMEARDGSAGFDFSGTYTQVQAPKQLKYRLDDDREVEVYFKEEGPQKCHVSLFFEPENQHEHHFQQQGWQAILDHFAQYVHQTSNSAS
jgi:uncharacterized protein YndB with AHSA1/START domain